MPALKPTDFTATVTWIGRVVNRDTALASAPCDALTLGFDGPEGEAHGGAFRPSCSRVSAQHRRGTTIRNVRQLSIVSFEELAETATRLGLDHLDPSWLGASLCLRGLPDLSLLPPSSRLQGPDGVTLVIDMQNRPCHLPDPVIRESAGQEQLAKSYRAAAKGRRGVTAWVESEGILHCGDTLRLHVPDQPAWPYLNSARGMAS